MTKEQVLELNGKKHVKIYKLYQLGIAKKEIAELLNTNAGHVFNVLKDYANNEQKRLKADNIIE